VFGDIYNGKRVLITGHTGFKGSWLALWLSTLGAEVIGYSLPSPTNPNHIDHLNLNITSIEGDIRNREQLSSVFTEYRPEIIFHLAAQAIVKLSYQDPTETFMTNVMGTVNVLEISRHVESVGAIINIASDKCYENREWPWPYREIDPLGGFDPYSASKGCAELVAGCWRNAYFNPSNFGKSHKTLLASCRAGNVIGGGDWAQDRLIPDLIKAVQNKDKAKIRNPHAIRPWQHVLEPLSGYLLLGQKLLEERSEYAQAWNFGPQDDGNMTVLEITSFMKDVWSSINYEVELDSNQPHEAGILKLDCSKAHFVLGWSPVWTTNQAILKTAQWYKAFYESEHIRSIDDLNGYISDGSAKHITWVDG
jgi:CDP-glucose 4,6-dehydratase